MFFDYLIAISIIVGVAVICAPIFCGFSIGLITLIEYIEKKRKQKTNATISDDIYNLSLSPKIVEGYNYLHQVLHSCDEQGEINAVKKWGEDWYNRIKFYYLRKKIYHPIAVEKLFYDLKSEWIDDCANVKWNIFFKNANEYFEKCK